MITLLVGFDSAWTSGNLGALVDVVLNHNGTFQELGPPLSVDYQKAEDVIRRWQTTHAPTVTIVLLDQPTIVVNATGQRPVENIVASVVSRRYGAMQPANTAKSEMFGKRAPVWAFLDRFGGPADPLSTLACTGVFETYPVLAIIALGWTLPDSRRGSRLPKYNPERKETFSQSDWEYICHLARGAFSERGLVGIAQWIECEALNKLPRKRNQDCLDACICLLVALHLVEGKECLMVGNLQTGYIVVPDSAELRSELEDRCNKTHRLPSKWMHRTKEGVRNHLT